MYSTCCPPGSAFSTGSPPLFGVVLLALLLLTYFTSLPLHRRALVDNLSALPPEVTLWYFMLARPLSSIHVGSSRLWVPLLGTVSHPNSALFLRICPMSSSFYKLLKKMFFSPGLPCNALLKLI